jgi:large subunit ribosomal protein L13
MPTKLKHYNPSASDVESRWRVFDADGKVLGRLASEIATILMGKHRASYVPHMASGDFVVVVNAAKVDVTGRKSEQMIYRRHSQYPGNLKEIPFSRMLDRTPERVIELAVRGMLPKTKLGRKMLSRLKVYSGPEHPHMAQVIGSERAEMRDTAS